MPEAEVLADLRWNPKMLLTFFRQDVWGCFFWMASKTLLTCELLFRGVDTLHVVGWRLINDRQLFGYFYTFILSCLVGWGGVGWDNNVMSKCVSHVLAPWSSLPVGWGEEGWGGVGY